MFTWSKPENEEENHVEQRSQSVQDGVSQLLLLGLLVNLQTTLLGLLGGLLGSSNRVLNLFLALKNGKQRLVLLLEGYGREHLHVTREKSVKGDQS